MVCFPNKILQDDEKDKTQQRPEDSLLFTSLLGQVPWGEWFPGSGIFIRALRSRHGDVTLLLSIGGCCRTRLSLLAVSSDARGVRSFSFFDSG